MAIAERTIAPGPEPAWEIAHLFPYQGTWTEEEYLALDTNHLIEFSDGYLEFLPMPTQSHQFIALFLYRLLWAFATSHNLGHVLTAPLRLRVQGGKYREPDVLFVARARDFLRGEQYWRGADLVMEVVSPDDPGRDYEQKRQEYAEVGIAEYWIVDPRQQLITILVLDGGAYRIHGEFRLGVQAHSKLLDGFVVNVDEVFAAAV